MSCALLYIILRDNKNFKKSWFKTIFMCYKEYSVFYNYTWGYIYEKGYYYNAIYSDSSSISKIFNLPIPRFSNG